MIKVTVFARFKTCMGDVNLIDVLSDIRNGKYATSINRIRACMDKGDLEAADMRKKHWPAITISSDLSRATPCRIYDSLQSIDYPRF